MLTNVSTAKSIVKLGIFRKMRHRIQAFFFTKPKIGICQLLKTSISNVIIKFLVD